MPNKNTKLTGVLRYDAITLKGAVIKTDEGYIKGEAVVTRAGIFKYRNDDGTERLEFRPPEEVFHPDSMESLKLKPITNGHPQSRLVDSNNAKEVQVGNTGERIDRDANDLLTSLVITHADAISDVVNLGKKELSCGYTCDVEKTDGDFEGEHYTHRQTNIRYNHVAICNQARAGHGAKLNFQRNDAIQITEGGETVPKEEEKTVVADDLQKQYDELLKKYNELKAANDAMVAEKAEKECAKKDEVKDDALDKVTAERDSLKVVVDSIPTQIADAIKARRQLEVSAAVVIPEQAVKFDSMTEKEIYTATISARFPQIVLDSKSDEYVKACFDMAVSMPRTATPADINRLMSAAQTVTDEVVKEGEKYGSDEARKSMIEGSSK